MMLVYATFALVSAPTLMLFGAASDGVGPRLVLRVSTILAAVGSSCFALASGPIWLVVGRAAQGIALGTATGAASALISKHSTRAPGKGRGAILTSTAFVAGTAAGPIASGMLAQYAPAPYVLPYVLHLLLLAYGWRRVSTLALPIAPLHRWRPARPHIPRGIRCLFTSAVLTGFLAWTVVGLFLALIPTLLDRAGQTNLALTGCVLGAVLFCSVLTQPFVARLGTKNAQLAGLAALVVSLTLLTLSTGDSALATLVAAVAAGAGHGLAYGGATAAIDAATPLDQHGAVTGPLYLAFYLGSGCPAIVVGLITLSHPLTTATSLVTATAAGLVPIAATAVVFVNNARQNSAHAHCRRDGKRYLIKRKIHQRSAEGKSERQKMGIS
jgi:MFS family permease